MQGLGKEGWSCYTPSRTLHGNGSYRTMSRRSPLRCKGGALIGGEKHIEGLGLGFRVLGIRLRSYGLVPRV
jgi:hypothetical protein